MTTDDTRRDVLDALEAGPVTGPELATRLDVSRAAIWKHVETLRETGIEIESGSDGYRVSDASAYAGPAIEYGLDAPYAVEYHDEIGSTNDRARALAGAGEGDVVVVADEQTGGRGRLDRKWRGPPGGVWLSVVRRPVVSPAKASLYTLAGALATTEAVRSIGVDARIKWPNDVVVPGATPSEYRKLAGVLTEMEGEADRVRWVVVGVGLNADVDSAILPDGATSVRAELDMADPRGGGHAESGEPSKAVDRTSLVRTLLEEFHECTRDPERVVPAWREHALTLGQHVRVDAPGGSVKGVAIDVTETGALVLDTEAGERRVTTGDCQHLRPQ